MVGLVFILNLNLLLFLVFQKLAFVQNLFCRSTPSFDDFVSQIEVGVVVQFFEFEIQVQLVVLQLVEAMKFVVPPASNDQRVHLNEEFIEFEIAHLNFRLLHLLFYQHLFILKLLPYFVLLFLLLLCHLLPLDFFFVLLDFILHFLHLLLILFRLLINFIFCFSNFLQANRLPWVTWHLKLIVFITKIC